MLPISKRRRGLLKGRKGDFPIATIHRVSDGSASGGAQKGTKIFIAVRLIGLKWLFWDCCVEVV